MPRKNVIIRLDEDLHKQLKIYVAKQGITIQDFVLNLITDNLDNIGEKPNEKNNRTGHNKQ